MSIFKRKSAYNGNLLSVFGHKVYNLTRTRIAVRFIHRDGRVPLNAPKQSIVCKESI